MIVSTMDMTTELEILGWIHSFSSPGMDAFMLGVTTVSTYAAVWLLTASLLMVTRRERRTGCSMVLAIVVAFILVDLVMKPLVCRERPCEFADFDLLVPVPDTFSFPSGHTAMAFAGATVLFIRFRAWGIPAMVLATLVGISRMYLYVHWPTDVLVGALVGTICAVVVYKLVAGSHDGSDTT